MARSTRSPGTEAPFTLSAFGDEIDADLEAQLRLLKELRIGHLELRSAWGVNVTMLDDSQVEAVAAACSRFSIRVSCIGSPVGKSPITRPLEQELARLERVLDIAEEVGTRRVRVFSFYPLDEGDEGQKDRYLAEVVVRLSELARHAESRDILLLLENEKGVVGDTPERCHAILKAVDSPHLRFVWDPANFVQVSVARPTERGWPLLAPYVAHVQVKDALLADGSVRVAGEGDAQVPELLARLRDDAYGRVSRAGASLGRAETERCGQHEAGGGCPESTDGEERVERGPYAEPGRRGAG